MVSCPERAQSAIARRSPAGDAATAWSQVYGLPLDRLLTPAGLEASARLATECRATPTEQPLRVDEALEPAWNAALDANTPGGTRAPMPILYLQGTRDEQIPLVSAHATLERLCAAGDRVEYREIDGATHAGALYGDDRLADARAWLTARLDGDPLTVDACSA